MHMPGAQGLESMHPAAKMCTQGAGCTLNFEHWTGFITPVNTRMNTLNYQIKPPKNL